MYSITAGDNKEPMSDVDPVPTLPNEFKRHSLNEIGLYKTPRQSWIVHKNENYLPRKADLFSKIKRAPL